MAANIRDKAQGNRNIWILDPRIIKQKKGWNVRDDTPELAEHIKSIARSICAIGFLPDKAITVYADGDDFYVSDGHCRLSGALLAIKMGADLKAIPCVQEARGVNEADRVLGMLTRNSGMNLTPLEQGKVYKLLLGLGYDEKMIEAKTGKSAAHVKYIFDLMEANPGTHAQVIAGSVSPSTVVNAVREHGPAKAEKVIAKAVKTAKAEGKTKATARDVREAVSGEPTTKRRSSAEVDDFFRITLTEQNGPPGVQKLPSAYVAFREGRTTPERFMEQLAELTVTVELVEV